MKNSASAAKFRKRKKMNNLLSYWISQKWERRKIQTKRWIWPRFRRGRIMWFQMLLCELCKRVLRARQMIVLAHCWMILRTCNHNSAEPPRNTEVSSSVTKTYGAGTATNPAVSSLLAIKSKAASANVSNKWNSSKKRLIRSGISLLISRPLLCIYLKVVKLTSGPRVKWMKPCPREIWNWFHLGISTIVN